MFHLSKHKVSLALFLVQIKTRSLVPVRDKQEYSTMLDVDVLTLCQQGIEDWKAAFNRQDSAGCAGCYAEEAIMYARPFGRFEGRDAIQAFWQGIIEQGFADVSYSDTTWEPHPNGGYMLTSKWTMNNAFGVVHKEHWHIEQDGKARLIFDDFEVQGAR